MNTILVLASCILAYISSIQLILYPSVPQTFAIIVILCSQTTIAAAAIDSQFIQIFNRVTFVSMVLVDHILLYSMRVYPYNMLACSICILVLYTAAYCMKLKSASTATFEIILLDVFALALHTAMHADMILLLAKQN